MKSILLFFIIALHIGLSASSYELIIVDNNNKALENISVKILDDDSKVLQTIKSDKYGLVEIEDSKGSKILVDTEGYKSRIIEFEHLDSKQTMRLHKMRDYSAKDYLNQLFQEDVKYVEIKGNGEKKQITFPKRPSNDAKLKQNYRKGYHWVREFKVEFDDDEVPVFPSNSENSNLKNRKVELENDKGAIVGYLIDDSTNVQLLISSIRLINSDELPKQSNYGFYQFILDPGTYSFEVTALGYDTIFIKNLTLSNDLKKMSFRLKRNGSNLKAINFNEKTVKNFQDYKNESFLKNYGKNGKSVETMSVGAEKISGRKRVMKASVNPLIPASSKAGKVKTASKDMIGDIKPPPAFDDPKVSAGKLTAGILNDFQKWDLWNDLTKDDLEEYEKLWQISPRKRYSVMISNDINNPVIGAKVSLVDEDGNEIWSTISDNLGKAELWGDIYGTGDADYYEIKINYNGVTKTIEDVKEFHDGINTIKIDAQCNIPQNYDISFVIDATGSMGDEIEFLKAELFDIIERSKSELPNVNFNMSSMFYRDVSDNYLIRKMDFTDKITQNIDFLKLNEAGGGGDYPEAVDYAFETALDLNWSENAVNKIIFFFLDAPPHQKPENIEKIQNITKIAAQNGIRVIPVACSGTNKSTEYLMRSIALATGGKYIFLTDDSGIGGKHIKPSTDNYEVMTLNDILFNTIIEYGKTSKCEIAEVGEQNEEITYNPDYLENANTEENIDFQSWTVFPNPAKDFITIKTEGDLNLVFVGDMRGNILERLNANGNSELKVDLTKYPNGSYMIMSEYAPNQWMTTQIILTR